MNNELVDDGTSSPMKRRRNNATNSKQYFKLNTDGRNYCQYGDCTKSYAAKTSTTNLMRKKRQLASKTQQILKHQHQRTNLQFLLLLNLKRK